MIRRPSISILLRFSIANMQYYVKPNDVYLGVTRRFVCFSVRMPSWEPFRVVLTQTRRRSTEATKSSSTTTTPKGQLDKPRVYPAIYCTALLNTRINAGASETEPPLMTRQGPNCNPWVARRLNEQLITHHRTTSSTPSNCG